MNPEPTIRQRIYKAASGIIGLLALVGLITPDAAQLWLAVVSAGIGVGVAVLALVNHTADTWAALRAAVYTLVAALGPAFATLGVRIDERWPILVGQLFTIGGAILAIDHVDNPTSEPASVLPPR